MAQWETNYDSGSHSFPMHDGVNVPTYQPPKEPGSGDSTSGGRVPYTTRQQKLARMAAAAHASSQGEGPVRGDATSRFLKRNLRYVVGVVVVALVVALGIVLLAPLVDRDASDRMAEQAYVSPYDWSKLDRTNGRYAYVDDGVVKSRLGIDVSENQHQIDWSAVAADGIDFAMIRLGYRGATAGDLYLDEYFHDNLAGAANAGIDRGIYFFSQANTPDEAREEANFVLENLGGADLQYPIVFDSEEHVLNLAQSRTSGLSTDQMTEIADAFCKRIEAAGYDAMVYGNAQDMARYRRSEMEKRDIWWAEYDVPAPSNKLDIVMWQYSNGGQVAGIPVAVDMNIDLTHALD